MIFVTGPMFSGKKAALLSLLHWTEQDFAQRAVQQVEALVEDGSTPEELLKKLAHYEVLIASEVGGGVVPMDPRQRAHREAAGRLAILLAREADTVIRVFCGIPTILKGTLP